MTADWSATPGGYDLSHWDGDVDWPALLATDPAFIVLKATEGMHVDPKFDVNRRAVLDAKVPLLAYPFLTPTDAGAEVAHFYGVVGDPKVPAALDWERKGVRASVVEAFIRAAPRTPLVYYGLYPPAPVTPLIARCPRWYAQYPGSATAAPRLPAWDGLSSTPDWSRCWLMWQWSETGRVPGVSVPVDMDRLACSRDVFNAWYATGALPAAADQSAGAAQPLDQINRVLRLNSSGQEVMVWQRFVHVQDDGSFGPLTREATIDFQVEHDLPGDGVVGPVTLAAARAA